MCVNVCQCVSMCVNVCECVCWFCFRYTYSPLMYYSTLNDKKEAFVLNAI